MAKNKPLPPLSGKAKQIKVGGVYEHFKGDNYRVIGVGRDSEDLHEVVIYQGEYEGKPIFVRAVEMFLDNVQKPDYQGPRFQLIE
ncbi:MAG: DUF1653 domain-containing protein [Candidatus Colwellbacteria bacterium]|nr:DUF1653 domain-containing protein [Candidatus Colwellbacteria bacterium]